MSNRKSARTICCVVPPHILAHMAQHGTAASRTAAMRTLDVDGSFRSRRMDFSARGGLQGPHSAVGALTPSEKRSIYDARHLQDLPGRLIRAEGHTAVRDEAVNQAYDGLGDTFAFYLAAYQRDSIDNAGLPLNASVHFDRDYDNAFWNGQQMVFGDGDGVIFTAFTACIDVIGHELTHGVTGSEANLVYQGQSGALNESISDVFGSLVKQYAAKQMADKADWLIGAGLLAAGIHGVALRSMKAPGTAYDDPKIGKDPQPAKMADYVQTGGDNGGVHINSGIPNRAFYLAAAAMGGYAWEKAGRVWYDTVCDKNLRPSADFSAFAKLTVRHASVLYGVGSDEHTAVREAWKEVGVK